MSWQCIKCGQICHEEKIPGVCPNFICRNKNVAMWRYVEDNEKKEEQPEQPEEKTYREADSLSVSSYPDDLREAERLFASISYYSDAANRVRDCKRKREQIEAQMELEKQKRMEEEKIREEKNRLKDKPVDDIEKQYLEARALFLRDTPEEIVKAKKIFHSIQNHKDSAFMVVKCDQKLEKLHKQGLENVYQLAKTNYAIKNSLDHQNKARQLWLSIPGYKDSDKMAALCLKRIDKLTHSKRKKRNVGLMVVIIILSVFLLCFGLYMLFNSLSGGQIPDPKPTPTAAPTPAQAETIAPETEITEPDLKAHITFYNKAKSDLDYVEAVNCMYSGDYSYKVLYLFDDVDKIPSSTVIRAEFINPDNKTVIKDIMLAFIDLDDGTRGWRSEFSQGELKPGTFTLNLYTESGKLISSKSIAIVPSMDVTFYQKNTAASEYYSVTRYSAIAYAHRVDFGFQDKESIPGSTTLKVVFKNPGNSDIISSIDVKVGDLSPTSNGWYIEFDRGELSKGIFIIEIYDENDLMIIAGEIKVE